MLQCGEGHSSGKSARSGVKHNEPSMLHVDTVSLAEEMGEGKMICIGDLTGALAFHVVQDHFFIKKNLFFAPGGPC